MLNRRKAMMGWLIYMAAKPIAKRVLRRKAQGAVPGTRSGSKAPNNAAILAAAAAALGALMFWRRRGDDDSSPPETPES